LYLKALFNTTQKRTFFLTFFPMNALQQFTQLIPAIENKIGYTFKDKQLLTLAFVHRSFVNEYRGLVNDHNERLEFLGDAVLGMLITEFLYLTLPHQPEGQLSRLRSHVVEAKTCASFSQQLGIDQYLLLGRGEKMSEERGRLSILADLFEALIGAIFLDRGLADVKKFIFYHFQPAILALLEEPSKNWKAELQEYTQKIYQQTPTYDLLKVSGPDHQKHFLVAVMLKGKEIGRGQGLSKKEAQQAAAEQALKTFK
jgi:ribonuclease III